MFFQSIVVSDASAGSFMVTLDFTASGGSVQTSGEIAYNADATGSRSSVHEILEVSFSRHRVRVGCGLRFCLVGDLPEP